VFQIDIHLPLSVGVLVGVLGAVWIYQDGQKRNMDTADLWAIGFFIAFIALPMIGGILVLAFYFQKRNQGRIPPTSI
jgi:peptidoglycan/LPS O-acetylase OafA/YrhL